MSRRPSRTIGNKAWRQLDETDDIEAALDAELADQQHRSQRRSDSDRGAESASTKRPRFSESARSAGMAKARGRRVELPAAAKTPEEVLEGLYDEEEAVLVDNLPDEDEQLREDRPWDQQERQNDAERPRKRPTKSTAQQYEPQINAFKDWCEQNNCPDRVMSLRDVPKLAKFFDEYCSRCWPPRTGGRNRKQQSLGKDAAMNLHAALAHHVKCCCVEDGVEEVDPKKDPSYLVHYRQYAESRDFTRKHDLKGKFSKEDHLAIARDAYAKGDSFKMLLMSLAIAIGSGGDDIRDLMLKDMRMKKIDAIGPITCWTIQFDRQLHKGKSKQQEFIRNRVPEACPMGWMGQHFHKRFKLDNERLPPPGSAELDSVFLFPGRNAGTPISYTQHTAYLNNALATQEKHTDKSTHVLRVHATDLLNAMGVDLDAIRYPSGRKQPCFGTSRLDLGSSPQALLALGMWQSDGIDFNCFWHPRMRIGVAAELLWHALPQLKGFTQQVDEAVAAVAAGDQTKADAARHKDLARVLCAVVTVAIQDAIELADSYPRNTFIADMNQHPLFRHYVRCYKDYKDKGGFENERPSSLQEQLNKLGNMLTRLVHGQSSSRLCSSSGGGGAAGGGCSSNDGGRYHPVQAIIPGNYGADCNSMWEGDHDAGQGGEDGLQEAAAEHQQQQQAGTAGRADRSYSPGGQQQQQGQQQQEDDEQLQREQQQQQQQQHRSNTGSDGSQDGVGGAQQQQQQQQQRQQIHHPAAGKVDTPGGHQQSMAESGEAFTAEGEQYCACQIPHQHAQLDQQPVSTQQQYRYPPQHHQQPYSQQGYQHYHQHHQEQQQQRQRCRAQEQQMSQQQPRASAGQANHQLPGQRWQQQRFRQQALGHLQQQQNRLAEAAAKADCSEYIRLVVKQIALLQKHLGGMPQGPDALEVMKQISSLLEEVKQLRGS